MSTQRFVVRRDERNRLFCRVSSDITIAIQLLAETDPRWTEQGVRGFAVIDVKTTLGTLRIRNVHITYYDVRSDKYRVQWFKHNLKGEPVSISAAEEQHQWLDVAGPLDPTTRRRFADLILGLFHFIRAEARKGVVFPRGEAQTDGGAA